MKNKKINWGIISTALIAREHLIPAINSTESGQVMAVASRDINKARDFAKAMNIPRYYGSYEELLADSDIDAVYNPLPNHLHIPWSLKSAEAGKHILCEKPVAINQEEASKLETLSDDLLFMEAFMVRFHLQWKKTLEIIKSGELGEIKAVQSFFSYYNKDPQNIRNIANIGGGAMYDIGCYPTVISKYIFGKAPERVVSLIDNDPEFKTDRLTSAIYDYGNGKQLTFSVATQLVKYQRVHILGDKARLEVQIPFNAIGDEAMKIFLDDGSDLRGSNIKTITIPACNQYRLQCEAFNQAIIEKKQLPYGIQDAIENMKIIDAVFRSRDSAKWEKVI